MFNRPLGLRTRVEVELIPLTLGGCKLPMDFAASARDRGFLKLCARPCGRSSFDIRLTRFFPHDYSLPDAMVAAARCGAGNRDLMIDIGQRYTSKQAMRMAERFEKYRLHGMEKPSPPDDFEGYRRRPQAAPEDRPDVRASAFRSAAPEFALEHTGATSSGDSAGPGNSEVNRSRAQQSDRSTR